MQQIIYSLTAASAAMLGAFLVLKFYQWSEKNSFLIINFAAGIMLAIAFTHPAKRMMPAFKRYDLAFKADAIAISFISLYVIRHMLQK